MVCFEADLDPGTGAPRVRFNFANGWSLSIVLQAADTSRTRFRTSSVAACPTGCWGMGITEIWGECSADKVAAIVADVAERRTYSRKPQ